MSPNPSPLSTRPHLNRPPSNSVSSSRSRVDSIEPRTPSDGPIINRHSLLTLSDTDPFAGRGISRPILSSNSSRLSAHSSTSGLDSKKADIFLNRGSYASSSSHSHQLGGDLSPNPISDATSLDAPSIKVKRVIPRKSASSLHRQPSVIASEDVLNSAWENLTRGGPVAFPQPPPTLASGNRLSQPEAASLQRPPMRARGLTDVGAHQRTVLLANPSRSQPHRPPRTPPHQSSPRVIIRQASMSRIGAPPSAPPSHELPPPPVPPPLSSGDENDDDVDPAVPILSTGSASSSTLSFASSVSSNQEVLVSQHYSPRQKEKKPSERAVFSASKVDPEWDMGSTRASSKALPPTSSRTLKKALSHQSLSKRSVANIHHFPPEGLSDDKVPRKQRSFHHPRLPIPPIPLSLTHTPSTSPFTASDPIIPRPSSSTSFPHGRKRLFSGSNRRPSTSQCIPSEDDAQSVFSIRSSEHEQHSGSSSSQPLSSMGAVFHSSYWEDSAHSQQPSSPISLVQEYTPQQIMSPAEMAKVEASIGEPDPYVRPRGLSLMSASTATSDTHDDEFIPTGLSPPPSARSTLRFNGPPFRRGSLAIRGSLNPLKLNTRPSTSQANMTPPSSPDNVGLGPISPSASPLIASLPPPPRLRQKAVESSENFTLTTSLPPPLFERFCAPSHQWRGRYIASP
ncbi:hypothetical protein BD779DRAFT_1666729 [Infundibulicybe gibba]|nr:hypothetical protein BD779DRAFT_1666729 [Infundibulicybe gibba]